MDKIEALETYNRKDNLIFSGQDLSAISFADALNTEESSHASSSSAEKIILKMCNEKLNVPVTPADITIAHRLKSQANTQNSSPIIVRFRSRKIRDTVFAAKNCSRPTSKRSILTKILLVKHHNYSDALDK